MDFHFFSKGLLPSPVNLVIFMYWGGPVPYLELFWVGPVKKTPCIVYMQNIWKKSIWGKTLSFCLAWQFFAFIDLIFHFRGQYYDLWPASVFSDQTCGKQTLSVFLQLLRWFQKYIDSVLRFSFSMTLNSRRYVS